MLAYNGDHVSLCPLITHFLTVIYDRRNLGLYAWIADRVKNNYGYETPNTLPQLYAQSRLMAFRANKEHHRSLEEMYAAQRSASTSAQSAPSPTLPPSPNDSSAGSASKDEPPESKSKLG